ncbi:MAG TPA: calcineurin-like phosphoesterase family protein [Candidatus Polarisedimenticolaceae bacterium]
MRRRDFLHLAAASAVGALVPSRPARVRGVVRSAGKGIAGVAVSDGRTVVGTASDGTFELVTTSEREFVQIAVPSGYRIPTHPCGTARFYAPVAPEAVFDLEPLPVSDERHTLLALGDIQTEDREEMGWFHERSVPDLLETIGRQENRHVVGLALGDLMFDDLSLYPRYEESVRRMGVPFFQVIGNHDLDQEAAVDEDSTRTFTRHFGPRYASFDRGAVHYVILDDVFWNGEGYLGYLDADQLAWLSADLALVEKGRTVVVATHIPLQGSHDVRQGRKKPTPTMSVTNRELLFRLLEPYRVHVLAGHTHESEHLFHHGLHEHVAGAICGAWWSGPICADGTPNGYAVYDVKGEEVTWRYKAVGRPEDHQIRVERADDGEIVANVWDWDPKWEVVLYVDGARRGAMERRNGRDPLSVRLHRGPDLPERRKWVEPYVTAHLFFAKPPDGARDVRVEATDRFGRVSTASIAVGPA